MKVLVTCGPTWVAIDEVRVISNHSTGLMGHLIAREFRNARAQVTLLQGPVTDQSELKGIRVVKFTYFDELTKRLKAESAKKYDIIVHAAAVSDFWFKGKKGKISSDQDLTLTLTRTPKLINSLKKWAPGSFIVGFKLETGVVPKKLRILSKKLFLDAQCDLVVVNQAKPDYHGYILNADADVLAASGSKKEIAKHLVRNLL